MEFKIKHSVNSYTYICMQPEKQIFFNFLTALYTCNMHVYIFDHYIMTPLSPLSRKTINTYFINKNLKCEIGIDLLAIL